MRNELREFTQKALERGCTRNEIAAALQEAGWPVKEAAKALEAFVVTKLPIPVPRPVSRLSARDAFLYIVLFATLYCSVWHFIALIYYFIDKALPDPATRNPVFWFGENDARWRISTLIVVAPLFLYSFRVAARRVALDPSARESGPRKWLTYLTLALSILMIATSLSLLIYSVLGGDTTPRFALKTLSVIVIGGGVAAWYFRDVRTGEMQ